MIAHLKSMGVNALSCYDRSSKLPRFKGSKSFRVTILNKDKPIFLNPENWFKGIAITDWEFREKEKVAPGGEGGPHEKSAAPPAGGPTVGGSTSATDKQDDAFMDSEEVIITENGC